MKRTLLIILLFSVIVQLSDAQLWRLKRLELSGGLGPSVFFGDVGGYSKTKNVLGFRDMTFLQTRFDVNASLKYRITQNLNARISLTGGLLHATDIRGSNENRNYETSTIFFEPALIGEYYFFKNSAENSYLFNKGRAIGLIKLLKSLDFYLFAGFGGLSYSVKANDKLLAHGLDPKGFTGVIPAGVGGTLSAFPNVNLGLEFGGRYAFSDNIDGYTSQFSSSNDVYYFLNLTVTYRMRVKRSSFPSFR
jgi:hypothetical protein